MKTKNNVFTFGNKKLPKTTAIFNMTTAQNCPSDKLGLCKLSKECYAKKAEKMYKNVVPFREKQADFWENCTPQTFVAELLPVVMKIRFLRISEAGDFRTQADVNKLSEIAEILSCYGVPVYCYTARKDLDFSNVSKFLTVNGSGFMVHNNFMPVSRNAKSSTGLIEQKYGCLADCNICSKCTRRGNKVITVKIH